MFSCNFPRAALAIAGAALFPLTAAAAVSSTTAQQTLQAACIAGDPLKIGGGEIEISYDAGDYTVGAAPICDWIARAAVAVDHYFGRFPVASVRLLLDPRSGGGVGHGTTYGSTREGRPVIVVQLGREVSSAQLDDDWKMTHEMTHLAVPSVPDRNHWLEEGIATYVEPIARVQVGDLSDLRIWADMLQGMAQGLPRDGDAGLDRTPTWGRTYWGGALFCLMADVDIRRRTGNRKGLQDALRGVLAAGGNIEQDWPIERVLAAGDRAIGVPALTELYRRLATAPEPGAAQLQALWDALGVRAEQGRVRLHHDAPLAEVRRNITAPGSAL